MWRARQSTEGRVRRKGRNGAKTEQIIRNSFMNVRKSNRIDENQQHKKCYPAPIYVASIARRNNSGMDPRIYCWYYFYLNSIYHTIIIITIQNPHIFRISIPLDLLGCAFVWFFILFYCFVFRFFHSVFPYFCALVWIWNENSYRLQE